jgi:hypothetical protein
MPDPDRELAARLLAAVAPAVAAVDALEPAYGPEAREWAAACRTALAAVEGVADGRPVTRFRLRLAGEAARCAAAATADAGRRHGPSPLVEAAELAYAAVALAADALRAESPARAADLAAQSLRAVAFRPE